MFKRETANDLKRLESHRSLITVQRIEYKNKIVKDFSAFVV